MKSQVTRLNVRMLPTEAGLPEYVLIEGNRSALEWLGNFLLRHAKGEQGCGMQIHPKGSGKARFARTATTGIYIHLLPCDHPTAHSEKAAGRKAGKRRRAG